MRVVVDEQEVKDRRTILCDRLVVLNEVVL